jgi:murein L,D-transpeptidase YafK
VTARPSPRPQRPVLASISRRLALGAVAFLAAIAALWLGRDALLDRDRLEVESRRASRAAQSRMGLALANTPDLTNLSGRLSKQGLALGAPVFIRIFKREFELELWLKRGDRFEHFATYPICRWSGQLGPKLAEGDNQAPEGFYTVDARALNPASRWHRSFNLGFPNLFDRVHSRTGSFVMVHGGCASVGCFAMTDPVVDEIWRLVTAALQGRQKRFAVHVFPFRMSGENLERRSHLPWAGFWADLKRGYDVFEETRRPPRIAVCREHYAVAPAAPDSDGSQDIAIGCETASGGNG